MVSTCCCCCDLRTAGIIIGVLALIGCILNLINFSVLGLIVVLINIPVAILWLIGIFQENTKYMLPNIIFRSVSVILSFFLPVYLFVVYQQIEHKTEETFMKMFLVPLLIEIVAIVLNVYFFIVEYSLYRTMIEKETPQNPANKFEA